MANNHFCDGIDDCGDNSDEAFCNSKYEFQYNFKIFSYFYEYSYYLGTLELLSYIVDIGTFHFRSIMQKIFYNK